jgi:hypothetical protein
MNFAVMLKNINVNTVQHYNISRLNKGHVILVA